MMKAVCRDALKRLDVSPLGCGALAGTAYEIDREQLAGWLGFASATRNSLDSVSDRDHVLELLSAAAIGMVHLSRFAEDLIFFNTGEAGFVELSDRVTSGSSLMPQKKTDALELIRGKCGRCRGVNRHDDDAERFAAGLQQRYAGRQRRSVRRARYGWTACIWRRWCWTAFR